MAKNIRCDGVLWKPNLFHLRILHSVLYTSRLQKLQIYYRNSELDEKKYGGPDDIPKNVMPKEPVTRPSPYRWFSRFLWTHSLCRTSSKWVTPFHRNDKKSEVSNYWPIRLKWLELTWSKNNSEWLLVIIYLHSLRPRGTTVLRPTCSHRLMLLEFTTLK